MKRYKVRRYDVLSGAGEPRGEARIVFLTDTHSCFSGGQGEALEGLVAGLRPDLLLFGGDMIVANRRKGTDGAADFLGRICGGRPAFYADGNHEQRLFCADRLSDLARAYDGALRALPLVRLRNERADVTVRGIPFTVYGLDPPPRFYARGFGGGDMAGLLSDTFGSPDPERFTILLAHTPLYTRQYLAWGANLTLCGHYHGGILRLGPHRGLITPDLRLFSPYCGGRYARGGANVVISAGAGEHTIPVRIQNPREVTLVTVRRAQSAASAGGFDFPCSG